MPTYYEYLILRPRLFKKVCEEEKINTIHIGPILIYISKYIVVFVTNPLYFVANKLRHYIRVCYFFILIKKKKNNFFFTQSSLCHYFIFILLYELKIIPSWSYTDNGIYFALRKILQ